MPYEVDITVYSKVNIKYFNVLAMVLLHNSLILLANT
jgi:hypothetical protein